MTVAAAAGTATGAGQRLDRRRVYIFPTRAGFTLAAMLVIILLGAINYDNALAYLLAFLLGGLVMVAMLHTYRNLAGLGFDGARARPVFAGDTAEFACALTNDLPAPRLALGLRYWPEGSTREQRRYLARFITRFDLAPGELGAVPVTREALQRGWLPLRRLRVDSTYPLGILRTWAYFATDAAALVYPAPRGNLPLPRTDSAHAGVSQVLTAGSDDYAGMRAYVPGDPVRAIAWKTLARAQPLMVKRFHGTASARVWLAWSALAAVENPEARLSQLTAWVLAASREGYAFGLELPGTRIDYGQGDAHRDACLRALALHGLPA